MAITLRTELYETAQRVAEKKKLEAEKHRKLVEEHLKECCMKAEKHRKLVEEHLKECCMKAASDGEFRVLIPIWPFEDGTVLTDEDIRVFARDYNLDYTPREGLDLPVLSWNK